MAKGNQVAGHASFLSQLPHLITAAFGSIQGESGVSFQELQVRKSAGGIHQTSAASVGSEVADGTLNQASGNQQVSGDHLGRAFGELHKGTANGHRIRLEDRPRFR